ncbi:Hypothetical predicted protein [Olea europaea subsp. europaea]|uniref:Uncharacterized protein n=1 Tax=Olea europaea subsp. europaea TaxID=158383 RepID=A0A8S0U0J8_OLEEU|nr:Hypothetical predicted protein [Olea europaea subsp. europaea]
MGWKCKSGLGVIGAFVLIWVTSADVTQSGALWKQIQSRAEKWKRRNFFVVGSMVFQQLLDDLGQLLEASDR